MGQVVDNFCILDSDFNFQGTEANENQGEGLQYFLHRHIYTWSKD